MKKKIFVVISVFILLCMPLMCVCASPENVGVETAKENSTEFESVQENATLSNGLPKLPKPTNLKWNDIKQNGKTVYGYISWGLVKESHGEYDIFVYRDGNYVTRSNWINCYDNDGSGRYGVSLFRMADFTVSGKYTFEVVAVGDGVNYDDSERAVSGVFDFTAPTKALDTVQNVKWKEGGIITHSPVKNAAGYHYEMYIRRSFSDKKNSVRTVWDATTNVPLQNQSGLVEKDLSTYVNRILSNPSYSDVVEIYVNVKALTYDITEYRNGAKSDYSDAYVLREISEKIEDNIGSAVDKVENGTMTPSEALEEFLGIMKAANKTNSDLAFSMLSNGDIENDIDILEEAFIEETGVSVDVKSTASDEDYLSDRGIDVNEITIKGAALNSKDGEDVSLTFSEAEEGISADPKYYKNSVAVNIGMTGVENSQKLDIPVIIEMPIPAGVVPERLFILHYHADGSVEQIQPAIIYDGGKAKARFILTSFSTFIFCNAEDVVMGNVYTDDEVTEADADLTIKDLIALAQYISGNKTDLTTAQLTAANVYDADDIDGATVDVNINEKDIEELAQMLL